MQADADGLGDELLARAASGDSLRYDRALEDRLVALFAAYRADGDDAADEAAAADADASDAERARQPAPRLPSRPPLLPAEKKPKRDGTTTTGGGAEDEAAGATTTLALVDGAAAAARDDTSDTGDGVDGELRRVLAGLGLDELLPTAQAEQVRARRRASVSPPRVPRAPLA